MREPNRITLGRLPTPLKRLNRLSDELKKEVWVKRDDLTEHGCSGNKIRKLEYILAEAVANGATHVITAGAVQSNHCRATAIAAASLGLDCELILRGEEPSKLEGNLLLSKLAGAHCHYVNKETWVQLPDVFELIESMLEKRGGKPYSIPIGGSNPLGVWGYTRMIEELQSDMQSVPIYGAQIFTAVGSGGTYAGILAGLAVYLATTSHQAIGVLVSDDIDYFREKIHADLSDWSDKFGFRGSFQEPILDDRFIGPGYGKAGRPVYDLIQKMAKQEGLFLDPVYSAKAFQGMLMRVKEGAVPEDHVIFVHTGGLFGMMAQARELSGALGNRI